MSTTQYEPLDLDTLRKLADGSSVWYGNDGNQAQRIAMAREIIALRESSMEWISEYLPAEDTL